MGAYSLAVQSILEFPHKILRRKARKVRKIDRAINVLADDLADTLIDSGGVGLAANQIGSLHRPVSYTHLTLPTSDLV